ncbi:MAG: hypothetical protein HRU09_16625 [Oligoflexales bacterium]|nr:hypothetical protein [Oligoflexales bacterium]
MLGIRRYQDVAIDLWQGRLADFASDTLVICQHVPDQGLAFERTEEGQITYPASETHLFQYPDSCELHELWSSYLKNSPINKRHLAVAFTCLDVSSYNKLQVKEFFKGLKNFLDSAPEQLKRISLVFESLAVHDIFQDELFALFPYQE